jgi:hypothetical protein
VVSYTTADRPCASPPCPGVAQAGQDYDATSGTLTFGPGETSKTIRVPITADALAEGNETFLVSLTGVQGGATLGAPAQAVVTIVDDEQGGVVQFSAAAYTAVRPLTGSGNVSITLTRTGGRLAAGASVLLLTGTGTATPGLQYSALATTVVFEANATTASVPLFVFGDLFFGGGQPVGNLTVPLTLMSPGGGATLGAVTSALVTIVDSRSSVQFSTPSYTVDEGGTATITVLRGGPASGTVTVPFSTGDTPTAHSGIDYVARTTTLTFGPGVRSQTVTVSTHKRAGFDDDRVVTLLLGTPSPGTVGIPVGGGGATLTIRDVDLGGTFQFAPTAYTVVEGGMVTLTITRSGGTAGAVNVPWQLTGAAAAGVTPQSGNVSFAAGIASRTMALAIPPNAVLDGNRSFSAVLANPIGVSATAALPPGARRRRDRHGQGSRQRDRRTIQFTSVTRTVMENLPGASVTVPVSRMGSNLASGVTVDYTITGDTTGAAVADERHADVPASRADNSVHLPDPGAREPAGRDRPRAGPDPQQSEPRGTSECPGARSAGEHDARHHRRPATRAAQLGGLRGARG